MIYLQSMTYRKQRSSTGNRGRSQSAMRDKLEQQLYDLWRLASLKGYSLRLEGWYIRLVPLRTPGDNGLRRSFHRSNDGMKKARAWLEKPDTSRRQDTAHYNVRNDTLASNPYKASMLRLS